MCIIQAIKERMESNKRIILSVQNLRETIKPKKKKKINKHIKI